jgi:HAD superfamily hydrolase (TIGR01509 family)
MELNNKEINPQKGPLFPGTEIKALIFDFDGLLVDSEPIYVASNQRFLLERGITDLSIINRLFGMRAEEAFALMKDTHNLEGTVEQLMRIRNDYILDDFSNGKLKLMPDLINVLEVLKKHFILAIGSSSKAELLVKAMDIYNFSHYFTTIVCGDDVEKGKPEPDIYLKVAEKLKLSPAECIVLEDAPNGVLAGKRAGMITIAVPNEQTIDLKFPDPDFIVKGLTEVPALLGIN